MTDFTELRIVSLLPSATEIVHLLGLGHAQVGRSHECDYPASACSLPVCSRPNIAVDIPSGQIDRMVRQRASAALSIYDVDSSLLASLRPTHIVTQTQCKVCAVSLDDVEAALRNMTGTQAQIIPLEAHTLSDVWDDIRRAGQATGCGLKAEIAIAGLQERIGCIKKEIGVSTPRPRVVTIEWTDPLMVAGNWIPELIEIAGGVDVLGVSGQHSPYLPWNQIQQTDPDVIIGFPCGFNLKRSREEFGAMVQYPGWQRLRAVRNGQVYLCDGNQFMNRPGPRLVESAEIFAEILHPGIFGSKWENLGWERYP